jgi:hypothetical protein
MKFAAFPKFILVAVLVGAFTGCGFLDDSHNNAALTAGNWSFIASSTVVPGQISHIGGNLTVSGSTVSSTMHSDLPCFDVSLPFTFGGTLQNKQITFTNPANANGQVITLIASVASNSTITGSYSVTAGGGCPADQGTVSAALVPAMTGTWSGALPNSSGGPSVTLSLALTQASTASTDGTFALSGNLTFANSSCSASGSISNSSVAGSMVIINASTLEQDGVTQGAISFSNAFLNNPATPTSMIGDYYVSDGYCAGDTDTPTFTKQ